MESLFFEGPIWIGLCGVFVVVVAAYFWTQTGNKPALYTAAAAGLLTLILVMVNIQVVTQREELRDIMRDIATNLEQNNHDAVIAYIHPNAQPVVQRAKSELNNYEFSRAKITRIKDIIVNNNSQPPTAIAEFNVVVEISGQGHKLTVPRFIKAYLMQKDGKWLVNDYEHFEAAAGFTHKANDL